MIVMREGWHIPEQDRVALGFILDQVNTLNEMYGYCRGFRTVVQAGCNIGIWPSALSKKFEKVYTVEPDPLNYEAAVKNVGEIKNVFLKNAAFGASPGHGSMDHILPDNIGAHQVKAGNDFEIITVDSLGVTDCDLLQLDVEGFEHFAVEGAVNTIKASWPMISLELKGLGCRYGKPDQATVDFLAGMGYKKVHQIGMDSIFVKEN
jgi:FkbM family methyltransferase